MRQGFTLIELLVVIAIIAVLMALVTAAVIGLLSKGPELATVHEVRQLEVALTAFQQHFKLRSPPPSLLYLSNNRDDYNTSNALMRDSLQYLNAMFPRLQWKIDTNGDGMPDTPNPNLKWAASVPVGGTILEGDQCLVFFLGGMPTVSPNDCLGFSSDPSNPTSQNGDRQTFYEFKTNRLVDLHGNGFFSYIDEYNSGKPYLYFSSGKRAGGYNAYRLGNSPPQSDCQAFDGTGPARWVFPYAQAFTTMPQRYLNSNTFQIISAGQDGIFGGGTNSASTVWTPATADTTQKPAADDLTNFTSGRLSAGQ